MGRTRIVSLGSLPPDNSRSFPWDRVPGALLVCLLFTLPTIVWLNRRFTHESPYQISRARFRTGTQFGVPPIGKARVSRWTLRLSKITRSPGAVPYRLKKPHRLLFKSYLPDDESMLELQAALEARCHQAYKLAATCYNQPCQIMSH